ncbi:MAG TPA: hypothetical protein VMF59_10995 [Bacteroidota bacterium]|nr:hypothetical protein [Bacteroidota bacterium]
MPHFLLVLLCLLPGSPGALDTVSYTVPLIISDAGGHRSAITFGVHPDATYGFDKALGEAPLPPPPPVQTFAICFLDPRGRKTPYPGSAAYLDLRPYVSTVQADTYYVHLKTSGDAYPMTISWPVKLKEVVDSAVVVLNRDGARVCVNMVESRSVQVMDESVNTCTVITYGVKPHVKKIRGKGTD